MGTAKRFEDLVVWQMSRKLVSEIYEISKTWQDHSLQDHIRRAAVSVLSNIAEGFERGTKEEFLYFLYIARGSCGEVRAQLYVALDQRFVSRVSFEKACDRADHTSRMLSKFISGYKSKGYRGQKYSRPVDEEAKKFKEYLQGLIKKG